MKKFLKFISYVSFLLILMVSFLLSGCEKFEFHNSEDSNFDINANTVGFQENVVLLNDLGIDSVYIVSDEEIRLITSLNLDLDQLRGKVVVYSNSRTSANFFVGRVLTARRENGYITLTTEIPSMDEVFSELDLSAVLNMNNVRVAFTADDEDNVRYCGVVGNEVWDSISPVVIDSSSYNKKQRKAKSSTPIDLTLKFEAQAGQRFTGSIYYRIKGSLVIKKNNSYELSANQIIGLDGTFNMAEQSVGRTYIPLLSLKNGITLYTNKVIGIRVKPSLNFFYSGSMSLQAGFNYEVMNVDSYITYENENFSNRSWDNKREWYFRVFNLNAQASFGLSLNSDFYAFIFCDNFFRAGVKAAAGIEIAGEGNVGLQFPDTASLDCAVRVNPFLEVTPFVVVRKPNLQRINGPTFNVATSGFTADLLPNIHNINYQRDNTQLHYDGIIRSMNNSFVETKESGIALFEKGHNRPIDYGDAAGCMAKRGKAGSNFGSSFQIEEGKEYEIAPYVKSLNNEYVYGDRIEIMDDPWTLFYRSTHGDNWYRNDNWLSNADKTTWYGVSGSGNYDLDLASNNLYGHALIKNLGLGNVNILQGNNITSLTIDNSHVYIHDLENYTLDSLVVTTNSYFDLMGTINTTIDKVIIENSRHVNLHGIIQYNDVVLNHAAGTVRLSGSGNTLRIHNCSGSSVIIYHDWNYVEIIGGDVPIYIYGNIGSLTRTGHTGSVTRCG